MLTDEQLLQSQAVRDVLARMGNQGLHKTAGAVALGVDEVTLENAVLAICTKIAAQVLKEQRIASGLASLEKTAMSPAAYTALAVGGLGAGIGGYNAYQGARDARPSGDLLDRVGPSVAGAVGGAAALPVGAVAGGALGYAGGRALEGLSGMVLPQRYAKTLGNVAPFLAFSGAVDGALGGAAYAGREIGEKTAANPFTTLKNKVLGSAKTVPHMAPPPAAAAPIAEGADAVVRGMSPGRMGFAGKVTGAGAGAQVNPGVKSSIPTYMDSYTPQHIPHNPNKAVEVAAAAPAAAPRAKARPTQALGVDAAGLQANALVSNPKNIQNQIAAARNAPMPAHDPFAELAARGQPITAEGMAAGPVSFGRGPAGEAAPSMFNLQEMMARPGKKQASTGMGDEFHALLEQAMNQPPPSVARRAAGWAAKAAPFAALGAAGGIGAAGDYDNEHAQLRGGLSGAATGALTAGPLAVAGALGGGGLGAIGGSTLGMLGGAAAHKLLKVPVGEAMLGGAAAGLVGGGVLGTAGGALYGGLYGPYAAGRAASNHVNESADRALARKTASTLGRIFAA